MYSLYGIYAQMFKVKAFPQLWQCLYLMRHIGGIQMFLVRGKPEIFSQPFFAIDRSGVLAF